MTVYAIAQGRVDDREQFDRYIAASIPTLDAHHAVVLALDEKPDAVEGDVMHPRTVVLQFASHQAFYAWYNSAEYTAARKLRETASTGTFILVQGFDK
ncbi:MAG: hypothetical protein ACI80M_000710 [Gammaproteobacteria bacterium]|jgi:uncharacterized protein (DUF1330 family)|tara:strand:- start:46 stop:339 length:294 start_codon:yes stop_codon:yes gene_type:complete